MSAPRERLRTTRSTEHYTSHKTVLTVPSCFSNASSSAASSGSPLHVNDLTWRRKSLKYARASADVLVPSPWEDASAHD